MNHTLIASILLIVPALAQQPKTDEKPPGPVTQKLFILKYADPVQIRPLLTIFGANMVPNSDLHALAVVSSPEIMPAIEDGIKRLDVPSAAPQNIELTAYYLIGGEAENSPGGAVPHELDSVVTQLKSSFAFKVYHLMDTLTLRARTGQTAESSSNAGTVGPNSPAILDNFMIRSSSLSADGTTIRLDKMKAGIRMPVGGPAAYSYADLGLNADVDVKEDQKVVVGRLSVNKDQALFLVLTARLVK